MRLVLIVLVTGFALSACGGGKETVVVVPPGATVVCPNGSSATYSNGAYHC
jgi:hypothetical protein